MNQTKLIIGIIIYLSGWAYVSYNIYKRKHATMIDAWLTAHFGLLAITILLLALAGLIKVIGTNL